MCREPKSGFCPVSPVSTTGGGGRSLASPMRHDFMTLMRQASNRGSSSGAVAEVGGGPSPLATWSPGGAAAVAAVAGRHGAVDWPAEASTAARQTYGGVPAMLEAARHRRQRRASAFAAAGERGSLADADGAVTPGGGGGASTCYCPPCPLLVAGTAAATFARCSSSPDMRNGGALLLMGSCGGGGSTASDAVLLPAVPCTARAPVVEPANSIASHGGRSGIGGGSGSGGTYSATGSGSGFATGSGYASSAGGSAAAMARSCHGCGAAAGRNGSYELRPAAPAHSPLRPRDLPPPAVQAAAVIASGGGGGGGGTHSVHSASALPKHGFPPGSGAGACGGGGGPARRPASIHHTGGSSSGSNNSSYQQIRLLQQLREQHGLYHHPSSRKGSSCTAADSADAAAAAAVAVAAGPRRGSSRADTSAGSCGGGGQGQGINWVSAYFPMTESALGSAGFLPPPAVVAGAADDAPTDSVLAAPAAAAAAGRPARTSSHSIASPACTEVMLMTGSPSTALPSMSALLAATPQCRWTDGGVGDGRLTDSWAAGGVAASASAGGSSAPMVALAAGLTAAATVVTATGMYDGGGSAAAVSDLSQDDSAATLQQGVIVGSLRDAFSAAGAAALAAAPPLAASAQADAAAQAVLVIQNLLQRNALPDGGGLAEATHAVFHHAGVGGGDCAVNLSFAPSAPPPEPAASPPSCTGLLASRRQLRGPVRELWPPLGGGVRTGGGTSGCRPPALAPPGGGGATGAAGAGAEPMLLLPSRAASPGPNGGPDSLAGSGIASCSVTPLLASPQPSEHFSAFTGASGCRCDGGGGSGGTAAAAAATGRVFATPHSGVCSPVPSQLLLASPLDTASPSTPVYHGLHASLSMQSLYCQPSCSTAASTPAQSRGGGGAIAAAAAAAHSTAYWEPCSRHATAVSNAGPFDAEAAAAAAASGTAGGAVHGGGGGVLVARGGGGRSSLSACRGSSVFASESSLAAIALLRSAASNCPLPDDGSGAATGPGASSLNLDAPDVPSAAAAVPSSSLRSVTGTFSTAGGGSTAAADGAAGGRCIPLSSIFANVAWPPPPLALPSSPLLPSPPPGGAVLPSMGSPSSSSAAGAVVQRGEVSTTQSLRLEDGLVSDPFLLVDGLGPLSYVTSGAYAAVYRGTLEDIPVGIKFLASTSLDTHSPAVKEALLGPGLEHENIIRTYTTRVARIDGRAIAQLRAVAAAMAASAAAAAAAALQRKRSNAACARRFSCGQPPTPAAGGSPLSVPSTPLAAVAAAAAAPQRRAAGDGSLTQSPAAAAAIRPTTPMTPPPPGAANTVVTGSPLSPTGGHGRLQPLSVQASPARMVVTAADPSPSPSAVGHAHSPAAPATTSGQVKTRVASASGVPQDRDSPAGAATAASGVAAAAAEAAAAAAATRQLYMRKSVSANARAERVGYRQAESDAVDDAAAAAAAAAAAVAQPQPQRRPPALQYGYATGPRVLPRRGSAHALTSTHGMPVPPQSLGTPAVRTPPPPPRGGSATERLLDVLRTLGVVGPTGQPTADAHYVTAVVMEFADAGNLDTFSRAPCDLATAVDLLTQVARGMSYLHAHGLVHGDLKPANVLLLRDPASRKLVAKVADFGLSGLSGQLGCSGGADTCGTLAYSAPERLAEADEGGGAEQAADVYSFGICMQQLVSGVRPFADLTFGQVMFSVLCLKTRPPWPAGACGSLEPLYDMCCDESPARRPTFDQVVAWLGSLWVKP